VFSSLLALILAMLILSTYIIAVFFSIFCGIVGERLTKSRLTFYTGLYFVNSLFLKLSEPME